MPYINQIRRKQIRWEGAQPATAGELNYLLTKMIQRYLGIDPSTGAGAHTSYTQFNEVVGALECIKLELYRRAIAPYEDKKIKENGDVY